MRGMKACRYMSLLLKQVFYNLLLKSSSPPAHVSENSKLPSGGFECSQSPRTKYSLTSCSRHSWSTTAQLFGSALDENSPPLAKLQTASNRFTGSQPNPFILPHPYFWDQRSRSPGLKAKNSSNHKVLKLSFPKPCTLD